jgi:hypothetical protein
MFNQGRVFQMLSTLRQLILRQKKCKILQITYAFIPSSMHMFLSVILFTSLEVREDDKIKKVTLLRH